VSFLWLLLLPSMTLLAQANDPPASAAAETAAETAAQDQPDCDGLWPGERMIELTVRRWAAEAASQFELTEEQHREVERSMLDRWPRFFRENRNELQPLVNEFFEARLELEPPSPERVRNWAERAMPVFDRFAQEYDAGVKELRPLLTDEQGGRFIERETQMRAWLALTRGRLSEWQQGRFETAEWWEPVRGSTTHPPPTEPTRVGPVDAGATPANSAAGSSTSGAFGDHPPDQVVLELDAWDRYVADVIERFRFNDGQQQTARSILKEMKDRALAHRNRHRDEITQLEENLAAGNPDDSDAIGRELTRLYGPIDEMFRELSARVELIPTAAQRRAATQPAPAAESQKP